jgi:hypothetical protein
VRRLTYAHADTEHKRKAIKAAVPDDSPIKQFVNLAKFTVDDEEELRRLLRLPLKKITVPNYPRF